MKPPPSSSSSPSSSAAPHKAQATPTTNSSPLRSLLRFLGDRFDGVGTTSWSLSSLQAIAAWDETMMLALSRSFEIAARRNHGWVYRPHLSLALLQTPAVAAVIADAGVDLGAVESFFDRLLPATSNEDAQEPRAADTVRVLLEAAVGKDRRSAVSYTQMLEHLLWCDFEFRDAFGVENRLTLLQQLYRRRDTPPGDHLRVRALRVDLPMSVVAGSLIQLAGVRTAVAHQLAREMQDAGSVVVCRAPRGTAIDLVASLRAAAHDHGKPWTIVLDADG